MTRENWQDMQFADAKGHPSTFEAECKRLRARVAELEAALERIEAMPGEAGRFACAVLMRAALKGGKP